jgi:hypothetical protein
MTTAVVGDRAEQLTLLRRRMAAMSAGAEGLSAQPEARLPVPESLAGVLPDGLPRGTVVVLSGARSLSLSMVAAVTAAGGNAAIVGQPDVGLLAAVEMGANLSRLAVIPDPGTDPVEVAAVLTDGMDLVVLGLNGHSVPPIRTRAVVARARQRGCTLLVAGGDWPGAALRLEARVCGYETGAPGFGRISKVQLQISTVSARGRAIGRIRTG